MTRRPKPVLILGGKGSGAIVAQAIHDLAAAGSEIESSGFLNDSLSVGTEVNGLPVRGKFEDCILDGDYCLTIFLW